MIAPLKAGRSTAKESEPIKPIAESVVDSTLPHLPPTVAAMVQLQLLTGARPGEICALRPCDVTVGSDGIWVYQPARHKTAHRGKDRRIPIGPKGQEILRPYLQRDPEQPCFRPVDAEAERSKARRLTRKTPMTPSQAARQARENRRRKPGEKYTKDSYSRAIRRACIAAGVEVWAPNRLRHTRGTDLRARFGLEGAKVVLGHSDTRTTEIYAERDFSTAAKIMREIG